MLEGCSFAPRGDGGSEQNTASVVEEGVCLMVRTVPQQGHGWPVELRCDDNKDGRTPSEQVFRPHPCFP